MAFKHGQDTVVKLNAVDLSAFTNTTSFGDETETHEVTCYGNSRKRYSAGLGDGKVTIGGVYDDGASGPRATIKPLKAAGTAVAFIFQPEGTGAGKAQSTVDVIIKSYNESAPVGDMISWTAELQMDGDLDETDQS
jgi:hypothetical protein